jgi:hypothetical protein
VLWGERFDETATAIFIAILRQRGLRVHLVGLDGLSAVGQHGLIIGADRTLGQVLALAAQAVCIIAPCDTPAFLRAENDPRLDGFIAQAVRHSACIVLNNLETVGQSALTHLQVDPGQFAYYGAHPDLWQFADSLATALLSEAAGG